MQETVGVRFRGYPYLGWYPAYGYYDRYPYVYGADYGAADLHHPCVRWVPAAYGASVIMSLTDFVSTSRSGSTKWRTKISVGDTGAGLGCNALLSTNRFAQVSEN
jgi:hypothetical protein